MTIADHYTRSNLQDNKTKVLGCLLGQQNGRVVSVLEAFEIGFNEDASGNISLDQERIETFETDMELCKSRYAIIYSFIRPPASILPWQRPYSWHAYDALSTNTIRLTYVHTHMHTHMQIYKHTY